MKLIRFFLLSAFLFSFAFAHGQSSIYVRNSSWQDFAVHVEQEGSHTLDPAEYSIITDPVLSWQEDDMHLITVDRDTAAIPLNDTILVKSVLTTGTDTIKLNYRLIGIAGGSELDYSVEVNGTASAWFDDGSFHEINTVLAGKTAVIKFKPDNDDSNQDRDLRFAIHDLPVYELDSTDFNDPNVLNVMAYNLQMLPFGVTGMPQPEDRADHLPAQFSPWQDVVIYAEVFDNGPREDHLIPAMQAAGFPYHTTILNDPGGGFLPWNGGVMIFSRWPIEASDEIDFELCGQASQDCLANKGIKYARVNKLGKTYHVFGTHMDAGSNQDDYEARQSQIGEMRQFIVDLGIPDSEPVVFGGDFNISPIDNDSLYFEFLDSIDPVIPHPIGYYESNFNGDTGEVIDHVWGTRQQLVPLEATNEVITLCSLHPDLWELYNFSDHRAALGRFVYPDIEATGGDTIICPGDTLMMEVQTGHAVTYQWMKDGQPISGETASQFSIEGAQEAESGVYTCQVGYSAIYGDSTGILFDLFYPFGVDTVVADLTFEMGEVTVDQQLCEVGIAEAQAFDFKVFPNPFEQSATIQVLGSNPLKNVQLQVFDLFGRQVKEINNITTNVIKLDGSDLAAGVYHFRFWNDGALGGNGKLIVR